MKHVPGDRARGRRLARLLADAYFWCQRCGGTHRLFELAGCRDYSHRDAL